MSEYDPVESLRTEVKRFCETNQFNAMNVTNFYVQARVVLNQYDQLRAEVERLREALEEVVASLAAVGGLLVRGVRPRVTISDSSWPSYIGLYEGNRIEAALDGARAARARKEGK